MERNGVGDKATSDEYIDMKSPPIIEVTNDVAKQPALTLDGIYAHIGEFGSFQRRVVFIISFVSFSTAFNNLGYVFWAARPSYHYCLPDTLLYDQLAARNMTDEQILNVTVPWENTEDGEPERSRCSMYETTDVIDRLNATSWYNESEMAVTSCSRWRYDTSQYESTIVTEWNLVCSQKWLVSMTQAAYMAGRIVGTQLYGHLLDRIGRRRTLLLAVFLQVCCAITCSFINNIYAFLVVRFLLGIQTTGELQAAFVIATEMVGPSFRLLAATMIQFYWAIAYMSLAGIAYLIRDRFTLQITISAPLALLFTFYWLIPETPRWLLAKGRTTDATALLKKMAKVNGRFLTDADLDNVTNQSEKAADEAPSKKCANISDLFRTPNICRVTLFLLYIWFVNSFVFYGLSLNATSIGGNDYINFFISGAVEIPAHIACLLTVTWFGRPRPLALSMMLAGLALLCIILVPLDLLPVRITLTMFGKASITYSYALVYLYTPEIYPTVIRGIGLGAGAMMARLGGVLAPYTADIGVVWKSLPNVLFGVLALLAGLMSLCLPETKDVPMAQTIDDGEQMAKIRIKTCCKHNDQRYDVNI